MDGDVRIVRHEAESPRGVVCLGRLGAFNRPRWGFGLILIPLLESVTSFVARHRFHLSPDPERFIDPDGMFDVAVAWFPAFAAVV